jgi:hypothetical protein
MEGVKVFSVQFSAGVANDGQYKADLRREAAVIPHLSNGFAIPESRLLGVGPTSRALA